MLCVVMLCHSCSKNTKKMNKKSFNVLVWAHRHSHTTFCNSSTLVSKQTLVAPYNSFRVYQHVPLRYRTPMAHTAYTCNLTEQACTTHMGNHGSAKASYLAFGARREDWPSVDWTQPTDWALIKNVAKM